MSGDGDTAAPTGKILAVDDDKDVLDSIVEGLGLLDFDVMSARSVLEAEATIARTPDIAVVLTDLRMPGFSGLDLVERLFHDRPEAQAIEIVVLSGHITPEDTERAIRMGVFRALGKPVPLRQLGVVVGEALEKATARRAQATPAG
jgi:DNA-binding NtrC family response regulator